MTDEKCRLCWKRDQATYSHGLPVCKGCSYEIDRVLNFLRAHHWSVLPGQANEQMRLIMLQEREELTARAKAGEIHDDALSSAS